MGTGSLYCRSCEASQPNTCLLCELWYPRLGSERDLHLGGSSPGVERDGSGGENRQHPGLLQGRGRGRHRQVEGDGGGAVVGDGDELPDDVPNVARSDVDNLVVGVGHFDLEKQ